MPIPMRPMRIGEILDAAVNLYRMHWKTLMLIVAFVSVPMVFLEELVLRSIPIQAQQVTFNPVTGQPNIDPETFLRPFLILFGLAMVQYFIIRPFLVAGTVHAVARAYLGGVPGVEESYKFALRRLGSILWVLFLEGLAIFAMFFVPALLVFGIAASGSDGAAAGAIILSFFAFIAIGVFAVILWIRWTMAPATVVIEDQRGTKALRRSWNLSKQFGGKIFGTLFLAGLIAWVVNLVFASIPAFFALNAGDSAWLIRAIGSSIAAVVTTPFTITVIVLLYFDLRIRKEGLDLAMMAQEVQRGGS